MVITIDGPAGSGKSTVARKLATRLGFIHLNSGGLFRAVGILAQKNGLALDDEAAVRQLASTLRFEFRLGSDGETIFLVNGEDLSSVLAEEAVGALASQIALLGEVRQILLNVQRDLSNEHSIVVEGRDSGTVVFPSADKKFYLDASPEIRAARRVKELNAKRVGDPDRSEEQAAIQTMQKQISERDQQDASRKIAPHFRAEDAMLIDTSGLNPEEVVQVLVSEIGIFPK